MAALPRLRIAEELCPTRQEGLTKVHRVHSLRSVQRYHTYWALLLSEKCSLWCCAIASTQCLLQCCD